MVFVLQFQFELQFQQQKQLVVFFQQQLLGCVMTLNAVLGLGLAEAGQSLFC